MLRMFVLFSPSGVKSFAGSANSVPRKKVTPRCRRHALMPQTSLRPEKQSMFHLIDSVRSGSHSRIHSRSWFASGQENSGRVSSHSMGSLVCERRTSTGFGSTTHKFPLFLDLLTLNPEIQVLAINRCARHIENPPNIPEMFLRSSFTKVFQLADNNVFG